MPLTSTITNHVTYTPINTTILNMFGGLPLHIRPTRQLSTTSHYLYHLNYQSTTTINNQETSLAAVNSSPANHTT